MFGGESEYPARHELPERQKTCTVNDIDCLIHDPGKKVTLGGSIRDAHSLIYSADRLVALGRRFGDSHGLIGNTS